MVHVVILAGGLGTRLAPAIPHLPKALAPIQGIPFLKLLLDQIERAQIASKVVLALGHKADSIQKFLVQQPYSFQLNFSVESSPLGTGGALIHALNETDSETLLVLNGDSYFDISFHDFICFHKKKQADMTIACREVEDVSRYGAVKIDPNSQRVQIFQEKLDVIGPGLINAGLYLIERRLLTLFSPGVCSLEKEVFPVLLEKKLFAYCQAGSFIDIGTPSSYNEAQEILKPWTLT